MKMPLTGVCEGGHFHRGPSLFPTWRKITRRSDVPDNGAAVTRLLLELIQSGQQIGGVLNYREGC